MEKETRLQATLRKIYDEVADTMSGLMDTSNMFIALYDVETATIAFPLAYQDGQPAPDEARAPGGPYGSRRLGERRGLTEWVIRHKTPLLVERDFDAWVEAQPEIEVFPMNTKCWLGAPMMHRNEVIGVIGLQNFKDEGVFEASHRDLLATIAGQAAVAISNVRLLEKEQQTAEARQRRLTLFQQISDRMAEAIEDPDSILELVVRAANDATGSDLTSVYRYDEGAAAFISGVRLARNGEVAGVSQDDLPDSDGNVAVVAERQEPVFRDEAPTGQPTGFAQRFNIRAYAGLPLTVPSNQDPEMRSTIGVLFVNFHRPHSFSEEEKEILRYLANQAALAIGYDEARRSAFANEQLAALGVAATALQHRLGNTINITLPAVMRLRYRIKEDPTTEEILDAIERNTLFANEVIQRMQTPLRREPFQPTKINGLLREAIQKCVEDNSERFPGVRLATNLFDATPNRTDTEAGLPQITIKADLAQELPDTFSSIGRMTEVFRVLVENAIKAIYPNRGLVTVSSRLISGFRRQVIRIVVTDTGKGIEDHLKPKLFREPVPRKEFGQGAGLGLWLSHIIVRSHRGAINLEWSEPGKGSTFCVRLPVLSRPPVTDAVRDKGHE